LRLVPRITTRHAPWLVLLYMRSLAPRSLARIITRSLAPQLIQRSLVEIPTGTSPSMHHQATSPSMHHQATSPTMRIAVKKRTSTIKIFSTSTTIIARCVTNQARCCAAQHATLSSICTAHARSCRMNLPTIGSVPTAVWSAWVGRRMGRNGAKQRMHAGRWSG